MLSVRCFVRVASYRQLCYDTALVYQHQYTHIDDRYDQGASMPNPLCIPKLSPSGRSTNPLAFSARALKLWANNSSFKLLETAHATFISPDRSAGHTGRRPRSPRTANYTSRHTRPRLPPTCGARNLQAVPERSLRAMLWI